VVFLTGMEEGVFPHSRTLLAEDEIEEERRLCYVGITRAEQQLYVTHAWRRTLFGNTQFNQPSRFLREIPDELLYKPQAVAVQKKAVAPVVPVVPSRTAAVSKTKHMSQPLNVAAPINSSAGAATGLAFKPGEKVRHSKWGEGTIVTATPRGDDTEIKVAFPAEGIKTLMAKYAPLVKI
jgi:DNA helicase II / ATP-dependent DNA helicase PcrA